MPGLGPEWPAAVSGICGYAVAMVTPTNIRFPDRLNRCLTTYARRHRTPKSAVVVRGLHEWLTMESHPGIVFVTTDSGERRAALALGPQAWTVAEAWQQHEGAERNAETVAHSLGLTVSQVEVALGYWADHRAEIDELIERHHDEQDEALAAWERRRALDAG